MKDCDPLIITEEESKTIVGCLRGVAVLQCAGSSTYENLEAYRNLANLADKVALYKSGASK
jgi:hypothetical protein